MYYERLKHSGDYPIIGVNTFRNPEINFDEANATLELARASDEDKQEQLKRLADFQKRHKEESTEALEELRQTAIKGENIFAQLLKSVRSCSLGQITSALYEVGGQYRRNM